MPAAPKWHRLKAITVENRAPDDADTRRLLHRAGGDHAKAQRVVHHVMLHLPAMPPVQSTGYHLWIGDKRIPQYFEFPGGISFKMHDASDLAELYRQPIRFVSDRGEDLHTGASFPDLSRHLTRTVGQRWHKVYRR
ncbi:MAG: hypothetical protein P4L83_25295 [Nevskia sp.]|nr:hypothetical protein [Nevskia sp.]